MLYQSSRRQGKALARKVAMEFARAFGLPPHIVALGGPGSGGNRRYWYEHGDTGYLQPDGSIISKKEHARANRPQGPGKGSGGPGRDVQKVYVITWDSDPVIDKLIDARLRFLGQVTDLTKSPIIQVRELRTFKGMRDVRSMLGDYLGGSRSGGRAGRRTGGHDQVNITQVSGG